MHQRTCHRGRDRTGSIGHRNHGTCNLHCDGGTNLKKSARKTRQGQALKKIDKIIIAKRKEIVNEEI